MVKQNCNFIPSQCPKTNCSAMTSKSITTKTTKLDAGLVASITHPTCLEASEVLLLRRPPQ